MTQEIFHIKIKRCRKSSIVLQIESFQFCLIKYYWKDKVLSENIQF